MNTTTITNAANGDITRITVIHHDYFFEYRWMILAILASALVAWALRKIFWSKDSN